MVTMLVEFLTELGISGLEVLLNSMGGPGTRARYRQALADHLIPRAEALSADSQRRLHSNPLRILDSKDERDREAVRDAPVLHDFLDSGDREHFSTLRGYLDALGIRYTVDPRLVRGLDYYTRTLFEIKGAPEQLGAGSTLVGGGRYDGMIGELGGPQVPAIGFAAGLERLLIASDVKVSEHVIDAMVAPLGADAVGPGLGLARELRGAGIRCEIDTRGNSLKSQLRRADRLGARLVLILGESELAENAVQVRDLEARTEERMDRSHALRIVVDRLMAASRTVDAQGHGLRREVT
jgi:histidyl-tRNA synthetase